MKKQTSCIFIIFLMLTASCREYREKSAIQWHTLKKNSEIRMTDNPESPACRISLTVDYLTGCDSVSTKTNRLIARQLFGLDSPDITAAADSFIKYYQSQYLSELYPLYIHEEKNSQTKNWYDYTCRYAARYLKAHSRLLQFEIKKKNKEGGYTTHEETGYLNLQLQDASPLTADSLFRAGTAPQLERMLLEELQEMFEAHSLNELKAKGLLRISDIYITDNILIEPDGICFHYQPDELAPHSFGDILIHLTYKKTKHILTEKAKTLWN